MNILGVALGLFDAAAPEPAEDTDAVSTAVLLLLEIFACASSGFTACAGDDGGGGCGGAGVYPQRPMTHCPNCPILLFFASGAFALGLAAFSVDAR